METRGVYVNGPVVIGESTAGFAGGGNDAHLPLLLLNSDKDVLGRVPGTTQGARWEGEYGGSPLFNRLFT
jgi:hypothetical protein